MPNFGKLTQDLIGGSLRINDVLVIDQQLNVIVGNVLASTLTGPLYTPSLTEQNSMQGISVFGNLTVQPGWFLGGDISTSALTVTGPAIYQQSLTVQGVLNAAMISSDTLMIDSILARTTQDVNVVGNLVLLDPTSAYSGNLFTSHIRPLISDIIMEGNISMVNGCLTLEKTISSATPSNTFYSSTQSGILTFTPSPSLPPGTSDTLTLNNPCIKTNSVVIASVRGFSGVGSPFVLQTTVTSGVTVFLIKNSSAVDTIMTNVNVQYVIF